MTTVNGSTSFSSSGLGLNMEGQLALLVLESEDARHDAATADKHLARDRFSEASAKQVHAMHEEADDILMGAVVSAAASATACAIQVGDVLNEPPASDEASPKKRWGEIAATAFNAASKPLGDALGDSPAANDRADAKQAGTLAEQASWQLDDAKGAIGKADEQRGKTLDWLAAESANAASTESGIIAGFA